MTNKVNRQAIYLILLLVMVLVPSLFYTANNYSDFSIFLTFFFGLVGGVFLTKGGSRLVFVIAFCYLVLLACWQVAFFEKQYGQPFDMGGDEITFYENWILWGVRDINAVMETKVKFIVFLLPNILYLKFLQNIGINSTLFFHINILNCFVGACTAQVIFKIGTLIGLKYKTSFCVALFVAMYPFLAFHNAKILRDPYIYLLFALFCLTVISKWSFVKKIIYIILIMVATFFVRTEVVLYLLLFLVTFYFVKSERFLVKILIAIFCLSIGLVALYYIQSTFGMGLENISEYGKLYNELRAQSGVNEGLGTLLYTKLGLAGRIIGIFYLWFSPIPPLVVHEFNLHTLYLSIGSVVWYVVLSAALVTIFSIILKKRSAVLKGREQYIFTLSFFVAALLGTLFITFTSGDARHALVFMPLFSIYGGLFVERGSYNVKQIFRLALLIIIILIAIIYVFLKAIT